MLNSKVRAGLLSLVFGMVSVAYAQSVEELDREIAKLKKENELLELKAKNENLRSGNEVSSAGGGGALLKQINGLSLKKKKSLLISKKWL